VATITPVTNIGSNESSWRADRVVIIPADRSGRSGFPSISYRSRSTTQRSGRRSAACRRRVRPAFWSATSSHSKRRPGDQAAPLRSRSLVTRQPRRAMGDESTYSRRSHSGQIENGERLFKLSSRTHQLGPTSCLRPDSVPRRGAARMVAYFAFSSVSSL
jgi:hypothetical protein